jgi:3D (Asp-Asp-Asp) domain-containing protein
MCDESGTLALYLYDDSTDTSAYLYSETVSGSGTAIVQLDDVISNLSSFDHQDFDLAYATLTYGDDTMIASPTQVLDAVVLVLANYTLTNYYTPVLPDGWNGQAWPVAQYPSGNYPGGLQNTTYPVDFLNAVDPSTAEGLGIIGSTIVRFMIHTPIAGYTAWKYNDGSGNYGYLENPSSDQQTAGGCPGIPNLGPLSVAVNTSNSDLGCGDQVYVPDGFDVRNVDDHGGGLGLTQIDIYIGQGGVTLEQQANQFGKQTNQVVLKILET